MKNRNVGICIILCIVTFGIYGLIWFAMLADEVNSRCVGAEKTASGGVAVIFLFLTLGIYLIYWVYKTARRLGESALTYLILCFLVSGIIDLALIQSKMNGQHYSSV